MGNIELFADLESIATGRSEPKTWCLVRWHKGKMCGPLSRSTMFGGLGFPDNGHVGRIELFDSREEAERVASQSNGLRTAIDVPTRVNALLFSVYVYCYHDGSQTRLREDVPYDEARLVCDIAKGRATGALEHRFKIWMDCARFLGTPPPAQLEAPRSACLAMGEANDAPSGCLACNGDAIRAFMKARGVDAEERFVEVPRPRHNWGDVICCDDCGRAWFIKPPSAAAPPVPPSPSPQ